MKASPGRIVRHLWCLLALGACFATFAQEPAEVNMLILKGNIEISFGAPAPVDTVLLEKLGEAGIAVTELRDFHPLSMEYLRQFHVVTWIGITPYAAYSRYYGPTGWQGGTHLDTVRANAELLQEYARQGGGLLLNPSVEEIGMSVVASHRQALAPYGIDTMCAQLRDTERRWLFYEVLNRYPYYMHWTEQVREHPITAGVSRIYYPGYTMRWDDNITTLPLYPVDPAWSPLVLAEESGTAAWFRGTPYEEGHWKDSDDPRDPVIAAARPFGEGRVGIISISNFFLYYYPYSSKKNHHEILFGPQEGKLMEHGDGNTPSDLAKLMTNLYHWLAVPAREAGFGTPAGIEAAPIPEQPIDNLADVWADRDPLTTGPVRPLKILVGARTQASDGTGSVADYAAAARQAGYDMIAFTETFEATTPERYAAFVDECHRLSDDELVLLPGIDVADARGNRFLLLGKEEYLRPHLLVENEEQEPGKRLIWTGHMLIGMGEVLPVAARPARLAGVREKGALPPELYSHCPGVAVATYRAGEQVDDGFFAYKWHVDNASIPIPIAVHEVYAPEEVATAAQTGLQTMLNADSPANAVHYFRQGHMSFGGNPMRYYLSSGPTIDSYAIDDWQRDPWTMTIAAKSDAPITDVIVRDQRTTYRHFRPNAPDVALSWSGDLGAQQWFITELHDAAGGRAIMSPVRTLPARNFVRCMDRQNWFSTTHFSIGINYTGRARNLPFNGSHGAAMTPPGVELPAAWCPMFHGTYAGPGFVVADYLFKATLFPEEPRPKADSYPIFNALPVDGFFGKQRYLLGMVVEGRQQRPNFVATQATITLTEDMPTGDAAIWPVMKTIPAEEPPAYSYFDTASGTIAEGTLTAGDPVDLPAPSAAGGWIFLDPVRIDSDGQVGPATPGATAKAGSSYQLRLMKGDAAMLGAMPLLDTVIPLTQGRVVDRVNLPGFAAENGGIAGSLNPAPIADAETAWIQQARLTTATIAGVSPHAPIGLWTAADDTLQPFGSLDGQVLLRLPLQKGGDFYAGNLLLADHPELRLTFRAPWTADTAAARIHNPTAEAVTATIRTAPIPTRKALRREVTVPAGASIDLDAD